MIKPDRIYRPDEIATLLAIDRSSVYRMIRNIEDPLPAFRPTGRGPLRVNGIDLIRYLDRRKTVPEDE
ncbi:MAG: helix-turn-helix domain-containing protein [Candidatus Cloacimonetes bacterium]|nr:helix-turn-helix domain-containing protein [Candidatus Cloacimonadota bacterium]